jgi:hypothetical protein
MPASGPKLTWLLFLANPLDVQPREELQAGEQATEKPQE